MNSGLCFPFITFLYVLVCLLPSYLPTLLPSYLPTFLPSYLLWSDHSYSYLQLTDCYPDVVTAWPFLPVMILCCVMLSYILSTFYTILYIPVCMCCILCWWWLNNPCGLGLFCFAYWCVCTFVQAQRENRCCWKPPWMKLSVNCSVCKMCNCIACWLLLLTVLPN